MPHTSPIITMAMMENPNHFVGGVERTGDGAHAKSQIKGQRERTQRAKPTHGRALLLHLGKYVKINISQYRQIEKMLPQLVLLLFFLHRTSQMPAPFNKVRAAL